MVEELQYVDVTVSQDEAGHWGIHASQPLMLLDIVRMAEMTSLREEEASSPSSDEYLGHVLRSKALARLREELTLAIQGVSSTSGSNSREVH